MVLLIHVQFFLRYLDAIQFFYGLAFFSMGLAILLEVRKASRLKIVAALPFLALFGLVHGTFEWLEMVIILTEGHVGTWFRIMAIIVLWLSLVSLAFFGSELTGRLLNKNWVRLVPALLIITWIILVLVFFSANFSTFFLNGRILIHYLIYFPATILAAWGLILQYRELVSQKFSRFAYNFLITAILFLLIGLIRIISVPKSFYFPSSVINEEAFLNLIHIPGPFFRGVLAVAITFFVIRGLRVFEEETRRRVISLEKKRRILDVLQGNLLKARKPEVDGLDIASHYESATVEAAIGGDFFDFVKLGEGKWAFAAGDVSGKGVEAASDAFLTTQAMRCLVFEYRQPKEIIERINNVLCRQTPRGFFVTMTLFRLDNEQGYIFFQGSFTRRYRACGDKEKIDGFLPAGRQGCRVAR